MIKKTIDIAAVFVFIGLFCVNASYAQAPHGDKASDQEWASFKGRAVTVINVPSYTYIELEQKSGPIWIAAPAMEVEVGDKVWASSGIEMRDHKSRALDRVFPVIHFVGRGETERGKSKGASKKESEEFKATTSPLKGRIAKAKGGYTLEELFNKKEELGGEKVVVRGMLVKASGKIMGKKWFHLQDGTGSKGPLDLVLTSDQEAKAGDTVLVTGVLGLDKDFGQGYKYDIIIEDAKIKIE